MANPHVCLCASVSVAARKFKGTLATHTLYPRDRTPAHQSLGDVVNMQALIQHGWEGRVMRTPQVPGPQCEGQWLRA